MTLPTPIRTYIPAQMEDTRQISRSRSARILADDRPVGTSKGKTDTFKFFLWLVSGMEPPFEVTTLDGGHRRSVTVPGVPADTIRARRETGGPAGAAVGEFIPIRLPKSGLWFVVTSMRFHSGERPPGWPGRGVVPDLWVPRDLPARIDGADPVLDRPE